MAGQKVVVMLTEQYDPKVAEYIIRGLGVEDLDGSAGAGAGHVPAVISPTSNFAKLSGYGGSAYNASSVLEALKRAVQSWACSGGKVHYRFSSAQATQACGRLIASGGYQNFPRRIRAALAKDLYYDVDFVNAQPVILHHIAQTKGWPSEQLERYVKDRDAVLYQLQASHPHPSFTRDDAKELVLAVLCGCAKARAEEACSAWLVALWEEARVLQDAAWEDAEYVAWKEGVKTSQEARRKALGPRARGINNEKGALLALVMQDTERRCLETLASFLASKDMHMDTYIHDGGLVRKTAATDQGLEDALSDARAVIQDKTGIQLDIVIKPWGPGLEVPHDFEARDITTTDGAIVVPPRRVQEASAGEKRPRGWPRGRKRRHKKKDKEGSDADEGSKLAPGVARAAYEQMKAEFEREHFYYVPGNTFAEVTPQGIRYYQLVHAKEYFDAKFAFGGKYNFLHRVSFLDIWRMDPEKKIIHRVDFHPSDDPTVFYLPLKFRFEDEIVPDDVDAAHRARLLEMFDTLVAVASGEDETLKQYLLNWMAHMLQKPLEQPGVCIVLTGRKGVGKDTLFDFFRLWVIGEALSHNYTETRQFFDKHDLDRKDRIFLKVEECDSALFKAHAKDFRARVTGKEGTINPKGKDPITFPNYARVVLTANQANPLPLNDDNDPERRVVLMAVSDKLKGNFTFFNEVYNGETGLFTPLGGRLVADLLLARDLSDWNPRVQPKNEYQDALVDVERSPEQQFIEEGWPDGAEFSANAALQKFQAFATERQLMSAQQVAAASVVSFGRTLAYFVRDKKLASRKGHKKATYYRKIMSSGVEGTGGEAGMGMDDLEAYFTAGAGGGAGGGFHAATAMR